MKLLYIFATSERPDAYINTLAYTLDHLQVASIFVIVISEHDYAEETREDELLASTVVANISEQLLALSIGTYIEKWNDRNCALQFPYTTKRTLMCTKGVLKQ